MDPNLIIQQAVFQDPNQLIQQQAVFQDQFALIAMADQMQEEGAERFNNVFLEFTNEMKKNFALLSEENRIFKIKAETAEIKEQMLAEAHLQAIKTNTACIEQLSLKLEETNLKFNLLQEEHELFKLSCSDVQPSKVFLDVYNKTKKLAEKIIASGLLINTFDKIVLNASPLEATTQIKPWLEARDLLIVWKNIIKIDLSHLKTMKELIFEASKFNRFCHREKDTIVKLTSITINGEWITNIPHQICLLNNLTSLDLTNNGFESFPLGVINMIQLKTLKLDENPINAVPSDISKLVNLEEFSVYNGALPCFKAFAGMTLPKEIGNLAKLKILDLTANKIQTIPAEIGKLTSLKTLRLDINRMQWLPKEICNLTLDTLIICDNPLYYNQRKICRSPKEKIEYLKTQGALR